MTGGVGFRSREGPTDNHKMFQYFKIINLLDNPFVRNPDFCDTKMVPSNGWNYCQTWGQKVNKYLLIFERKFEMRIILFHWNAYFNKLMQKKFQFNHFLVCWNAVTLGKRPCTCVTVQYTTISSKYEYISIAIWLGLNGIQLDPCHIAKVNKEGHSNPASTVNASWHVGLGGALHFTQACKLVHSEYANIEHK